MEAVGINNELIEEVDEIGDACLEKELVESVPLTEGAKIRQLEKEYKKLSVSEPNTQKTLNAYREWHKSALIYLSQFYTDADIDYKEFKELDNSGNGYKLRTNFNSVYTKYNLLMSKTDNTSQCISSKKCKPMVFISHSSKDKEFAEALVDLLEGIGLDNTTLFCSSVDGYGIELSEDVFETLRRLFDGHELFIIFIHSPQYYMSPVSLNEMGAAWVMRSDFCSILTKDMDFDKLKGVVNGSKISIKVDTPDAPSRLNQLEEKLINLFNLPSVNQTKWERKRNNFLKTVNGL